MRTVASPDFKEVVELDFRQIHVAAWSKTAKIIFSCHPFYIFT
jgi:hypothetical protein